LLSGFPVLLASLTAHVRTNPRNLLEGLSGSAAFKPPINRVVTQSSLSAAQPDLQPDLFRFNRAPSADPCRGALGNFEDIGFTEYPDKVERFFADSGEFK